MSLHITKSIINVPVVEVAICTHPSQAIWVCSLEITWEERMRRREKTPDNRGMGFVSDH